MRRALRSIWDTISRIFAQEHFAALEYVQQAVHHEHARVGVGLRAGAEVCNNSVDDFGLSLSFYSFRNDRQQRGIGGVIVVLSVAITRPALMYESFVCPV